MENPDTELTEIVKDMAKDIWSMECRNYYSRNIKKLAFYN